MQHARTRRASGGIERHAVAEHDATPAKRSRQFIVRRDACTRAGSEAANAAVPIGFREDDVQRNRRCAHVPQPRDEAADAIATPGPLADRRQAPLIDVNDDDAVAGRPRASRPQQAVVHRVVQPREPCGSIEGENSREEDRNEAAQKNQPTTCRTGALRSHRAGRLPHRDFHTAITRLRSLVRRLDHRVAFAV